MWKWISDHLLNLILGAIASILGYFAPITGVVGVVTAAILIDLFVGVMTARKKGKAIKSVKMWRTIRKLFYSLIIISLLFSADVELNIIELHKLVAWFIVGFEIWSILESVAFLTDHKMFLYLRNFMEDKIEQQVNIDLDEE